MRKKLILSTVCLALLQPSAYAENLQSIYQAAVENDPVMRAAEAKYRADRESEKTALGDLLPQINLGLTYQDSSQSADSTGTGVAQVATTDVDTTTEAYRFSVDQTIFDLSKWYSFKGGKYMSRQAEAEFTMNQQNLLLRTLEAYLGVLRAYENLSSSYAQESAIKEQLSQTEKRFNVGLVAITDVHESQAAYDLAKVTRLSDQGALETAYEDLSQLTGKEHEAINLFDDNMPVSMPEPAERSTWGELALQHNPTLKYAQEAVTAAEYNYKASKAGHYPTLSLSLTRDSGTIEQNFTASVQDTDQDTDTIALNLNIPLYSGGKVSSSRRRALANYDQSKETLVENERAIKRQTRALHIAVSTQIQTVAARKQAIVSVTSALKAIRSGYSVGTRTIVDILDAQRDFYQAQRDYAQARYDYILNVFQLKQAAGLLSPKDIETLNEWIRNDRKATLDEAVKDIPLS